MTRAKTDLTPELAARLLAKPHPKQRRVTKQVVERYARAIREGRWRLIDDGLLVVGPTYAGPNDPEGSLFNGAHRCHAVVAAGRAIPVYVDWDADPSTFDLIDQVHKRAAAQFVEGSYAKIRAAAARMTLWYEHRFDRPPGGVNLLFDMHEVLEEVERRGSVFEEAAPLAYQTYEYTGLSSAVATAAYGLAIEMGYDEQVRGFVEGIERPMDRPAGDPARLVAERFLKQHHRARRRTSIDDWTVLVRALNLHLEGRRAAKLQLGHTWPRVGEEESKFQRRRKSPEPPQAGNQTRDFRGRKTA